MSTDETQRKRDRMIADRVTDEMLTMPVGELTDGQAAVLQHALSGAFRWEIMDRIDQITRRRAFILATEPAVGLGNPEPQT